HKSPVGIEAAKINCDTTRSLSIMGMDMEARYGLDERSDIGVRVPGLVGIVLNYKRRLTGESPTDPALAMIVGGGVVNAAEHAHFEFTLLYSARQSERITPYGGVKVMQVVPLTQEAT